MRFPFARAFVVSIVAFALAPLATAHECRDLDVRKALRPNLRKFFSVPRDQGQTGFCFAYAAADLLTVRLQQPVSGFELALAHSASVTPVGSFFRGMIGEVKEGVNFGGEIAGAFSVGQSRGYVCREDDIPSNHQSLLAFQEVKNQTDSLQVKTDQLNSFWFQLIAASYPNLSASVVQDEVVSNRARSSAELIGALDARACQARPLALDSHVRLEEQMLDSRRPELLVGTVDQVLESGRPVGLSYRPFDFMKPQYRGTFMTQMLDSHASVIIGRKQVGEQCMYVIRNSWGANACRIYKEGTPCRDSDGTFMISEEDLSSNALSVSYIAN